MLSLREYTKNYKLYLTWNITHIMRHHMSQKQYETYIRLPYWDIKIIF